jgi:hypothetical protein
MAYKLIDAARARRRAAAICLDRLDPDLVHATDDVPMLNSRFRVRSMTQRSDHRDRQWT